MAISQGTWAPINQMGPTQPINETSTTQQHRLLERIRCRDVGSTNYGEAEFVYLKGLASTAVGDLTVYNGDGVTTRTVARVVGPAATAMSECLANQFGWYQVFGLATVKAGTIAANKQLYLTATAGQVDDAVVAGDQVTGAISVAADDTGLVKAMFSYPSCNDNDNA